MMKTNACDSHLGNGIIRTLQDLINLRLNSPVINDTIQTYLITAKMMLSGDMSTIHKAQMNTA